MSINKYNQEKQKWIEEYKNLIQIFKNEELGLLKLFLIKNYHLNKVYKKYAYGEKETKNYYIGIKRKIKILLNEKEKNKKFEKFKELVNKTKEESNKEYKSLINEENKIINELKSFDSNIIMEYENDYNEWLKSNKIITLDNSNFDIENTSISNIDKNEQKRYFISTNYNTDNDCIKNSELSSVNQNNKSNNLNYIIENLNDKNKSLKLIDLNYCTPNIIEKSLQFFENPIRDYIKKITKEINNIYISKYSSKTMNNFNQINNSILNIKEENKIINEIKIYLNKIPDEKKTIYYLYNEIKNINNIIKEELGGIYLGWVESEHKEFIKLKKMFKDKNNSFLFLSTLNNIFPYMTVNKIKKHIKLFDIYIKLENIKNLLIEKYNSMKYSIKSNKNFSTKQLNTSISVTKSFVSCKTNFLDKKRNYFKSFENKRNITTIKNEKLNKIKIKKDYFKNSLKCKMKDNFYKNENRKSNNYNSINVARRRTNYYLVSKNK